MQSLSGDEYINIKEAADLTGKNEKTIRRFISAKMKSTKEEDARYFRKESIGLDGKAFKYLINKQLVVEYFLGSNREAASSSSSNISLDALVEQLREKDKQLERKDAQIESLQRENSILLVSSKQLQDKLLLIDSPRVVDGEVQGEVKKKSKGLLGWLFRGKQKESV